MADKIVKKTVEEVTITAKLSAALLAVRDIPGSDIKVDISSGVVTLSSDVRITESQKSQIIWIAQRIDDGVKGVSADGLKTE